MSKIVEDFQGKFDEIDAQAKEVAEARQELSNEVIAGIKQLITEYHEKYFEAQCFDSTLLDNTVKELDSLLDMVKSLYYHHNEYHSIPSHSQLTEKYKDPFIKAANNFRLASNGFRVLLSDEECDNCGNCY
ncbi:MAG: hypothetical protein FWE01_02430 [Firmicutes bacterium]|nr:hypothetical protein [Bacillota bacterium]